MFPQIIELLKILLLSPAFKTEIDAYEQDFRAGTVINIVDLNGDRTPLTLSHPLKLDPLAFVDTCEPPTKPPAPYPRAYVYHLMSEYPEKEQEYDIVNGTHRIGLSLFANGTVPADAEMGAGRYMASAKKLIERNQYIFGGLPRAVGASTVSFVNSIVPGMQLPKTVIPYHSIIVVKLKELRQV